MVTISFGPFDLLAVVGAATGIAALVWQVVTWRKSTHSVKVGAGTSNFLGPNGLGETLLAVTARNVGAAPVDVVGWGVTAAEKGNLQAIVPYPNSPTLPVRLANGSQVRFYMPKDEVRRYHAETGYPYRKMHAWVSLGTGQTIKSRKALRFRD